MTLLASSIFTQSQGPPANFVHNPNPFPIAGLGVSTEQQAFIREKAIADAHRLASDISLQSNPNSAGTTHDGTCANSCLLTHSYGAIYPIPSPTVSQTRLALPNSSPALPHHARKMSKVMAHGRKLSAKFSVISGGLHSHAVVAGADETGELMAGHRQLPEVLGVASADDVFGDADSVLGLKKSGLFRQPSRDSVTLGGGASDESDKEGVGKD